MAFPVAVAVPVALLGAALAGYCALQLVRRVRSSFVSRFPVAAMSRVGIDRPGAFILNIETPQVSFADFGMGALTLSGTLREVATGRETPLRLALMGAEVSGVTTKRRPLFRFEIDRAGAYEIEVTGIPERESLAQCNFVLTRPLGLAFVPLILGIVLGMGALITAVVLPLALQGAAEGSGGDPLAAGIVDACLDGDDASCQGLAATAESGCTAGDPDACHVLGLLESQGRGAALDLEHAAELFHTACDGGVAKGCVNRGWALQQGLGVAVDANGAAQAFERACALGLGLGCHNLGALYYGLDRGPEALGAFERGCDLAEMNACHNLALLLRERNDEADSARAAELLRRACDAGLNVSCRALDGAGPG